MKETFKNNIETRCLTGFKVCILLFFIIGTHFASEAQSELKSKEPFHVNGSATFTNNGMSFIPAFSLGKPATIFNLFVGKKLSFEPEFRFSMRARPWSFIFWWRYHLINNKKFFMNVGIHPSVAFKTHKFMESGVEKLSYTYDRYFAGELTPTFVLNKHVTIGTYLFLSKGLDPEAIKYTEFLTLNSTISNILLTKDLSLRINPQVYFLNMGGKKGYYFSSNMSVTHKKFPISIGSMMNKSIVTHISNRHALVWNVNLIYSFHKNFVEKT